MRLYGNPPCPNPKWQQDVESASRLNFHLKELKPDQRMSPVFGVREKEEEL